MFKMIIEIDKEKLEKEGYNYEKTMRILDYGLRDAGLIKEVCDNARLVYITDDSNQSMAYCGIAYSRLRRQEWFKKVCTKWDLYNNFESNDGSFVFDGSYIESAKKRGRWL